MVFLLLGQTAEEKASSLTAMLYPGGMASFLFAVHPAKRNFFLCAFVVQFFNLGCGRSSPWIFIAYLLATRSFSSQKHLKK